MTKFCKIVQLNQLCLAGCLYISWFQFTKNCEKLCKLISNDKSTLGPLRHVMLSPLWQIRNRKSVTLEVALLLEDILTGST